ncbi:acetyl-CoA acyltransferase/acetyl-CoA acyltransferase [Fodinibius roseus]|uniref:acetyl-CoA C-acyltransferase n=1 Tax=Fodinibius roseus TaxID=1194090 RepID=A0A1M4ZMH4_9BACT|nr:acetyl-CoA C-acyltransferase [Fodinibius roseus]SHF19125.1 acetyl-CoA acyltransferase/acetyl-CoA acyltransferase [Fodinibius roseus]
MANQSTTRDQHEAVIVDGARIPFQRSGTGYKKLMAYDLGRMAIEGLIGRSGIDSGDIDRIIMGCVIQDVNTSNVARESALGAGLPDSIPAHTVTQACISSNQAVSSAVNLIRSGQARVVLAGGTETMSDIPIRFRRKFRRKLLDAQKYKSISDWLSFFKGLRPSDLLPEVPSIEEFSTGETMGESCDRMAARFGISRKAQDEYALRSHQLAARATNEGWLEPELLPAAVPPDFEAIQQDNGFREDTSMEKLSKLNPAFIKPHGTITAGNSSFLTDGASASLIMEAKKARELGLTPKAYLREYTYVAQDPEDELLLGPAYATPQLLDRMGLSLTDIDVFEFHEAFAGQILTVLKALDSEKFAREKLDRDQKVGEIPMDKFNCWGGSLSLGHPFGATGARLVTTAANRLHHENGSLALVAACAAGGQGHAMVLERYPA